jgi:nitroimidazol reductase NimA-like FMN-containing flavoprotein (pyridoxamine 5'-phosphate oxidase superfamily)
MVKEMTIFKLPKMEKPEIEKLLREQLLCRIAFKGGEYPYMAPFQYVFMDGSLYFHFTEYGKKMKLLERDKRVCVEIEKYKPDLSEYSFVVLRGKLKVVADRQERDKVIRMMAEEGKRKLSTNFLAAHGFKKDEDWSSFTPEKTMIIVKLEDIAQEIGLKSPS